MIRHVLFSNNTNTTRHDNYIQCWVVLSNYWYYFNSTQKILEFISHLVIAFSIYGAGTGPRLRWRIYSPVVNACRSVQISMEIVLNFPARRLAVSSNQRTNSSYTICSTSSADIDLFRRGRIVFTSGPYSDAPAEWRQINIGSCWNRIFRMPSNKSGCDRQNSFPFRNFRFRSELIDSHSGLSVGGMDEMLAI